VSTYPLVIAPSSHHATPPHFDLCSVVESGRIELWSNGGNDDEYPGGQCERNVMEAIGAYNLMTCCGYPGDRGCDG
jgi:hypothetical protein